MKYSDFINEIQALLDDGRALFDKETVDRDPDFRKWRHELTAAIDAIERQNYDIKCRVNYRRFTIGGYSEHHQRMRRYNQDLQDTVNELETIVKYFENYGEPPKRSGASTASQLPENKNEIASVVSEQSGKSIKERFESHPVVWGLSLLVFGFGSGFTAHSYMPIDKSSKPALTNVNCTIDSVGKLEDEHNQRVAMLQRELVKLESSASDPNLVESDQDKYKDSANRLRKDISIENASYQDAIQKLSKACD